MKRLTTALLSVLLLFGIFAINVGAEDIPSEYRPVIEKYIDNLQDVNKYDVHDLGDFGGGLQVFDGNLNQFGYSLKDISYDGVPELLIQANYPEQSMYLAAVYTIENGQAKKLILHEGSDNTMTLLGDNSGVGHPEWDNCIFALGDWDNNGPLYYLYSVEGTNLIKVGETRTNYMDFVTQSLPVTTFSQYNRSPVEIPQGPEGTIYRLYNGITGEHLYTSDHNETTVLANSGGWRYENVGWTAPTTGDAVYRLYNPVLNDHLYTTDQNEVNVLTTQQGWQTDNNGQPLFYSGGSKKIFRLYNPESGRHHLTTDENEYNTLPGSGWTQEGQKLSAIG